MGTAGSEHSIICCPTVRTVLCTARSATEHSYHRSIVLDSILVPQLSKSWLKKYLQTIQRTRIFCLILQGTTTSNLNPQVSFPTMAYDSEGNRTLLWICASLLLVFFIGSIWYWFYLQYHRKEDLRSLGQGMPGDRNQQSHSGPAQQQGCLGPQVGSGNGNYELGTLHGNTSTQRKTGGDLSAAEPMTVPPPSAARNDWGECYANQAPTNIISSLNKAALAQPRQDTADQRTIELSTDGRRHYSVTSSDSSGTP